MTNAWDDMRRAKENEYFERKNNDALKRLGTQNTESAPRSPVTGEPMKQEVLNGVVVSRCETSGGIWIDKDELQHLRLGSTDAKEKSADDHSAHESWLSSFFKSLVGD